MDAENANARPRSRCLHCGSPSTDTYCCAGCRQASELGGALSVEEQEPDAAWLVCDVGGLHCAACVSLIEATFRAQPGAREITINPALGKAALLVDDRAFKLDVFARALDPMGYRIGVARKPEVPESRALLMRLGICFALAGNSMVLSFAIYFGLSPADRTLFLTVGFLNFTLAIASLFVGGSYFLRNAWQAIRARAWHIDIPLALSVVLAFGGATWIFFSSGFGATYFDTFTAFIALMLLGKYAPARIVEQNRASLLEDDGISSLPQTRMRGDEREQIAASEIVAGDTLVFAPGDLVSVDAVLLDAQALCSLDWITGEPRAVGFVRGERVPAGAFNVGDSAFAARAQTALVASPLPQLLAGGARTTSEKRQARSFATFSRVFVLAVLAIALVTFGAWAFFDVERGLWAAVSVLIVACPCAIGLGTPLAREIAARRLRSSGVFVRNERAFDALAAVETIVFDKTGTLTEISVSRETAAQLEALAGLHRPVLATMVNSSNHPVARAVRSAVDDTMRAPCKVREVPGLGLEAELGDGIVYRLKSAGGRTVFTIDEGLREDVLAEIDLDEVVRSDAMSEASRLRALGFQLGILSGDRQERVDAIAARLGFEGSRCIGELKPRDKAEWLSRHGDAHTLFLGDGINDVPAFEAAACSGTPAIDRPFVPARTDFYYRAAGLWPIREAITASRAYAGAVRFNYGFALVYNVVVLSVAAAGVMSPLIAAIVMPASSLAIVLCNALMMRRAPWRSS
ncbi:MAG: heavy metal translocating P-type ATPase [Deltaproteobacteria bacterium]|nr:heavy metal translocating P-type ATPase [Deltaproteobacteria bacterium]